MDRRAFFRLSAGAALGLALPACSSGSGPERAEAQPKPKGRPTLRIAQLNHFVPAYDDWFDNEYTKRWGEEHDVDVVVDHIVYSQLLDRADTEVAAGRGHDLFAFIVPAARFTDEVIDHADIVAEIESRTGPMAPHLDRTVWDRQRRRCFGVPVWWSPQPALYRTDLWAPTGLTPSTWDRVVQAAPGLRDQGHPVGIGFAPDFDPTLTLTALLLSHGASIQDEEGRPALDSPAAVEAVKVGVELFRRGMSADVLGWDASSDNRFLASGQGSMTIDQISALRAMEQENPELAAQVAVAATPAGPGGAFHPPIAQTYVVWRFAEQPDLAAQFLVDLVADSAESLTRSLFYNLPGFPGSVPDLAALLAADPAAVPAGKYGVLADAAAWSTNVGHPGPDNPAVDEITNEFVVSQMFIAAARGEVTPAEAAAGAQARATAIFDKWRERGKL